MAASAIGATLLAEAGVSQTPGAGAIQRVVPRICEFLRAISGLAAIVALVVLMALAVPTRALDGERATSPVPAQAGVSPTSNEPTASVPSQAAVQPAMLFYLVATAEQAYEADWSENVAAFARHYSILYADGDQEYEAARQIILDYMLAQDDAILVRVIDLRVVP